MKTWRVVSLMAVVVTMSAWSARADMMTWHGMGLSEVVRTHAVGHLADNLSVYAGQDRITFRGVTYNNAYCVDLDHYAGSCEVTVRSASELHNGNQLAYLFSTYAGGVTTNRAASSLQVAFWEVLFETAPAFSATSGSFWISDNPGVAAAADVLLASIPSSYTPTRYPIVLESTANQDFIVLLMGMDPVPEPATMSLLIMGGLAMLRRRKC